MKLICIYFALAIALEAQTKVKGTTQFRWPDFAGQTFSRPWPVGSMLPIACRSGEAYFLDDNQLGRKLYVCADPNVWREMPFDSIASSGTMSHGADLLDFQAQRMSTNQLSLGTGCSIEKPCRARIGGKLITLTQTATVTLSGASGSGNVLIWIDSFGVQAGHSTGATLQCNAGCSAKQNVSEFPLFSVPLYRIPFSANSFPEVAPSMDLRAFLNMHALEIGSTGNLKLTENALSGSVSVDLSSTLDFGGLVSTRVTRRGTQSSRPPVCHVGELFYQTDGEAGLYHCTPHEQWQPLANGSASLEVQVEGASVGTRPKLNFVSGANSSVVCSDESLNDRTTCSFNFDSSSLNTTYARLNASSVYSAGTLQDFAAADMRLPISAAAQPILSGRIAYSTNTNSLSVGRNGANAVIALQDTSLQPLTVLLPNDTSTGTVLNQLAGLGPAGTALNLPANSANGAIGVVIAGAGTLGSASIATFGIVNCLAENSATIGDFAIAGTTTAGRCRSAGSSYPLSRQVIGRWLSNVGAGGTGSMLLFGLGQQVTARSIESWYFSATPVAAGELRFFGQGATNGTSSSAEWVSPANVTLRSLQVRTTTSQPAGGTLLCRFHVGGADQAAIELTIPAGSAAGSYLQSSGSLTVSAGQPVQARCHNSAAAVSASIGNISFQVDVN